MWNDNTGGKVKRGLGNSHVIQRWSQILSTSLNFLKESGFLMKPDFYKDHVHTCKKYIECVTFKLKFKLKSHPVTN